MQKIIIFATMLVLLAALGTLPSAAQEADSAPPSPIGRCINMGNGLEAPSEGEWGFTIQEDHFRVIAEAGFDSVRIPVRWSAHAETDYPYGIDADFMARVTEVVDQALAQDLTVVLNIHHYNEMMSDPDGQTERLLFLWLQIAQQFEAYPDTLILEVLNEPNNVLDVEAWNALQPVIIATIRSIDADRTLVVGGSPWNGLGALLTMDLPADDHLIATVHYYEPFEFTHQGAEWVEGSGAWLGTTWGSAADITAITNDLDAMVAWRDEFGVPVFIGEFGAYATIEIEQRAAWTATVARGAEDRGLGWCYWEFGSGFGAYIPSARIWRPDLLAALIPPSE